MRAFQALPSGKAFLFLDIQGMMIMSNTQNNKPWNIELNTFAMLLHLSQLIGILVPALGLLLPIAMWATNKSDFKSIDAHGRVVFNWMLSFIVYSVLVVLVFNIFAIFAVMAYSVVFIIIGAIQANKGVVWRYPLSIPFFKVDYLQY